MEKEVTYTMEGVKWPWSKRLGYMRITIKGRIRGSEPLSAAAFDRKGRPLKHIAEDDLMNCVRNDDFITGRE